MKNILYVHHGRGIGGAPLSLLYLIRGLDRSRFIPTVLCIHESEAAELFRREGIETIVDERMSDFSHTNVLWYPWWQLPKILLRLLQFPRTYFRARALLRDRPVDIIHLNTSTLTAFGMAGRAAGKRVVWHIREPLQKGYTGFRRMLIRRVIHRSADLILPICRYDGEQLIASPSIRVVYNFIDFAQFDATIDGGRVRQQLGIAADTPVALMLGGVNPIKGTKEYIAAAVDVLRTHPEAVFLVAGPMPEGSFRNRLNGLRAYNGAVMKRAKEASPDRIRFLGVRTDIPELLAASDVLCFPSTVPHFARPVIEASAMGLSVIASDLGGPQELVRNGETGYLVPSRNSSAIAEKLRTLFDDASLRKRLGAAGIAYAQEHFDAEVNTRRVLEYYDSLFAQEKAE